MDFNKTLHKCKTLCVDFSYRKEIHLSLFLDQIHSGKLGLKSGVSFANLLSVYVAPHYPNLVLVEVKDLFCKLILNYFKPII